MSEGDTGLAPFGAAYSNVPASIKSLIQTREKELKAGTFDDLTGPIYAKNGALEIKAGKRATTTQRETMSYLVKGIQGQS
jgi:hypothetical protein